MADSQGIALSALHLPRRGSFRASPYLIRVLLLSIIAVGPVLGQDVPERQGTVRLAIPDMGEDYVLSRVGFVLTARDYVLALDRGDPKIHVFRRSDGTHVRAIGRVGSGPGEFRGIEYMGVQGDKLWTWDFSLARVSWFELWTGVFLSSTPVRVPGSAIPLRDESILVTTRRTVRPGPVDNYRDYSVRRVRGSVVDTVLALSMPYRSFTVPAESGSIIGPQPFDDGPLAAVSLHGHGVVVVDRAVTQRNPTFTVRKVALSGQAVFTRQYPYMPTRITREMVDREVNFRSEARVETDPTFPARLRDQLFVPPHLPPIQNVLIGTDATIWVKHSSGDPRSSSRWTVLSPEGNPLFVSILPPGFAPFQVSGLEAVGVHVDEDGEESIQIVGFGERR